MKSAGIRSKFLTYFAERGHEIVPSSSLVPHDDPTLLFTNAGMVQFKDVFTGRRSVPYRRATTAQKCVRAGGKHNDLENVGRTARHHTFFEMLGNFSFGDYFKRDAIAYAWEFVTRELGLPRERLWASIYEDDDDAFELWREVAGLPAERIVRLGEEENFWAMGDTGPCGPDSELHYDRGEEHRCQAPVCAIGVCGCDRWLEVWNLVFMQFERSEDGTLTPLPKPSVDTGMGLERIASVLQGVDTNWDTDLFRPILEAVAARSGRPYDPGPAGFPHRVVADHVRACAFLVSDGVLPSNEGRGYVLRRILRRAARLGRNLGLEGPFLWDLVPVVTEIMGDAYPELRERRALVQGAVRDEEERFAVTLDRGLARLDEIVREVRRAGGGVIPGEEAFRLYDTFGFPLDLVADAAEEAGLTVDGEGFEREMEEQRRRAREDRRRKARRAGGAAGEALSDLAATEFLGYETLRSEGRVLAVLADGERVERIAATGSEGAAAGPEGVAVRPEGAAAGPDRTTPAGGAEAGAELAVVLDRTPFYAESGGQVGDTGVIIGPRGRARVLDTRREGGVHLHLVRVEEGALGVGETVTAEVDRERRRDVARNHSATHLLHRALKDVLGEDANQAGSLVAPDRLRFDFTARRALSEDDVRRVEELVNAAVLAGYPVETREMPLEEAKALGAMALFGERYGDVVRVVGMGERSLELCGGTHVKNTAEIGLFRITAEGGVGSGVRRVEAVTGRAAVAESAAERDRVRRAAELLKAPPDQLVARLEETLERLRRAERELRRARRDELGASTERLLAEAEPIAGGRVVVAETELADGKSLGTLADDLKARLGRGGAILAARDDGRVLLLASFTEDLVRRGAHAGKVVAAAAKEVGGGGGGRPDFAQAGGRDASRVAEALDAARRMLLSQVGPP